MARPGSFGFLPLTAAIILSGCVETGFFDTIAASSPGNSQIGCTSGSRVSPATIELGEGSANRADAGAPFAPLAEGDPVHVVRGGQGASMIVLSIRVTPIAAPTCIQQRTDVLQASGARISFNAQALPVDGTGLGENLFFPGDYSGISTVTVRISIGDTVFTRQLTLVNG